MYSCPDNFELRSNSDAILCDDQNCTGTDFKKCCAPTGHCTTYECPTGYTSRHNVEVLFCQDWKCAEASPGNKVGCIGSGVSSERDVRPLCVFACRWLRGVAVVGLSPPASPSSSSASLPGFFRLTFWPRFHHPRYYKRNQLEKKHGQQCSTSFCRGFDARLAGMVI